MIEIYYNFLECDNWLLESAISIQMIGYEYIKTV